MSENYEFLVIGGGSVELVAMGGAAVLEAEVLLVEKHALGGEYAYTNCLLSKAQIHLFAAV